jgi:hypothetical protein
VFADKEPQLGHKPAGSAKNERSVPLVSWEPFFCVLLQDEQTFTTYRSEEMAVSTLYNISLLSLEKCTVQIMYNTLKKLYVLKNTSDILTSSNSKSYTIHDSRTQFQYCG